jgi:DNA repair ATPase RecN
MNDFFTVLFITVGQISLVVLFLYGIYRLIYIITEPQTSEPLTIEQEIEDIYRSAEEIENRRDALRFQIDCFDVMRIRNDDQYDDLLILQNRLDKERKKIIESLSKSESILREYDKSNLPF